MAGPEEFLVVLMTALILPGIAILVAAYLLGGITGMESVKYVVLEEADYAEDRADDGVTERDDPETKRGWGT